MRNTALLFFGLLPALLCSGCGSMEETTEEEPGTWTVPAPEPPQTAVLEYRIDSLMTENRLLRQQIEAMAGETRSLIARNAELETRLAEALAVPKTPPPPADMTAGYTAALARFRERKYEAAATQFLALLRGGIREDLADNCHYWIGECRYGMGSYAEALEDFQMVFNYARSEKKDDAQMMVGNCYLALRNPQAAGKAFASLLSAYPASPYAERAKEKLASIR